MEPFSEYFDSAEAAIGIDALAGLTIRGFERIKSHEIIAALGPGWWVEYYETADGQHWTVFTNGRLYTGAHLSSE